METNYYLSCFIWHADIGQNIVNYDKKQDTKWYKILNQIWKKRTTNFKIKIFQNEEEATSTAISNIFQKMHTLILKWAENRHEKM